MPSGSKTVQGPNKYLKLKFTWEEVSVNNTNNTSSVKWTLNLDTTGSGTGIIGAGSKYWKVVIDGTTYDGWANVDGHSASISSGTATVKHNNDGTKTFNYSFSLNIRITWGGTYVGTMSSSGSGVLTKIPRQSSIKSITGNQLGGDITIELNRAVSSYTHKVDYSFEGSTYTQALSGIGTTGTFKLPIDLASRIPNATRGTLTIKVGTYSGSTFIGSVVTTTRTVYLPSSVKPTATLTTSPVGVLSGVYVYGKSAIDIKTGFTGAYGSAFKSVNVTVKDANGNILHSSNERNSTTRMMYISGAVTVTATVTDSRGRTGTATSSPSFYSYRSPYISGLSVYRCTESGDADPNGEYIRIRGTANIQSLSNRNASGVTVNYKEDIATSYITVKSLSGSYSMAFDEIVAAGTEKSYNIKIELTDSYNTSSDPITVTRNISTVFVLFNARSTGRGLAFGKVASRDGFDFGQTPMVNGGLMIFFTETEDI